MDCFQDACHVVGIKGTKSDLENWLILQRHLKMFTSTIHTPTLHPWHTKCS